jgi:hypothetical protein
MSLPARSTMSVANRSLNPEAKPTTAKNPNEAASSVPPTTWWAREVRGRHACPRQDSNLRTPLRRRMLYPLSYGGGDHRQGSGPAGRSPLWMARQEA